MEELGKLCCREFMFNYPETMKRLGYTHEDIVKVRNLIEKDEVIPKFITNGIVNIKLWF